MPPDAHERLLALDRAHVWHPFTQMQAWPDDEPLVIERAEGCYLYDDLGRKYLDGVSSLWTNVHGHRRPEIDAAIRAQLDRVAHTTLLGLASVPSIELAKKLVDIAPPGLTKVFYSDSGSTAVEIAVKMAYQYWRLKGRPEKNRFVALAEAYHGDTVGAVSVGGIDLFHSIFKGLLFPVAHLPISIEAAERFFREKGHEFAALVIEPLIQGAAGMLTQPRGFLSHLARLCREHDVLLICDEVATGFGRTGTMFAVEQEDVQPDLLCLAKGISGGYLPLAATLATQEIHDAFLGTVADRRTFFHGHTYTGNPLACAAAIASLEIFEKERTLEKLQPIIAAMTTRLERLRGLKHVLDIRQRGVMVGIQLTEYDYGERMGHRVCLAARKRGMLLRPLGNVVVLNPPLAITVSEAEALVDAVGESIVEVTER